MMISIRPRFAGRFAAILLAALLAPAALSTQGVGPDLVVADLFDTTRWGEVGGISAYSLGTLTCNLGDEPHDWFGHTNEHPVIAQNLYRLKNGRLEQIGMSWLKHGFNSLNDDFCGLCERPPGDGDELGVGCSDPYDSGLNGNQEGFGIDIGGGLGPRSEVNAATGAFPYPYGSQGEDGDAIYKRLQVRNEDLDPELNPGALYFIEGHYVGPEDAQAGNGNNNASYRQVEIDPDLTLDLVGPTQEERAGILAWADHDPQVEITDVDVPGDGRFTVAARAAQMPNGRWRYEYAVYNMNSHRSARGFAILVPAGVTVFGTGFHDVPYHSGEAYDGTDWRVFGPPPGGGALVWATRPFGLDPNANALRWGTMYNVRFSADAPPGPATAAIGLFRPGTPPGVAFPTRGPVAAGAAARSTAAAGR